MPAPGLDETVGTSLYQPRHMRFGESTTRRPHELPAANEDESYPPSAAPFSNVEVSDAVLREWYPEVAAAAAMPQPPLYRALVTITSVLSATFVLCLATTAAGCAWVAVGAGHPDLAPGPVSRTLLLSIALPITLFQTVVYLIVWLLASVPHLQAHIAFAHAVKHFPAASSAGPFDPSSQKLLPSVSARDHETPRHAGLPHARAIRVPTSDGLSLGAWHVLPASDALSAAARTASGAATDGVFDEMLEDAAREVEAPDAPAPPAPSPVVAIYLHGMGESRTKWVSTEHAKLLSAQLNLHVLLIDYRGFGDSQGYPDEAGLNVDAAAALAWLGQRGVRPSQVLLWGHSLGTGPAIVLAHAQERLGAPLCGLILEAPYTSLVKAAISSPSTILIRALPFGTSIIRRYFVYTFNNDQLLPSLSTPTLCIHGTEDLMVPFFHTVALARAVLAARRDTGIDPNISFVPLVGGGHLDAIFQPKILEVLAAFPRCQRGSHNHSIRRDPSPAHAANAASPLASPDNSLPATPSQPLCQPPALSRVDSRADTATPRCAGIGASGRRAEEATPAWLRQAAVILPPAETDLERA